MSDNKTVVVSALPGRPPGDARIGRVVGNLRLTELLGRGGAGAVYRAEHSNLGTPYAIKILEGDISRNPRSMERFRREAVACSKLRHPHVVFVTDFGFDQKLGLYLVMEYIAGQQLTQLMAEHGALPLYRVMRIADQISQAMEAAHNSGIVHRDLKPDNVMVMSGASGEDFVKVVDFGIARLRMGEDAAKLTQAGKVVGTPAYMSPEQVVGSEEVGPATDVYALGLILYEMVSGRRAFQGQRHIDVMGAQLNQPAPTLGSARAALAGTRLEQLCIDMLAKEPAQRPASMSVVRTRMAEALEELRGHGIPDVEPGNTGKMNASPRKKRSKRVTQGLDLTRLRLLLQQIASATPRSLTGFALHCLPAAGETNGDALALTTLAMLQQEVLNGDPGTEHFQRALTQLYSLAEIVLDGEELRSSNLGQNFALSVRRQVEILPVERRGPLVAALSPLAIEGVGEGSARVSQSGWFRSIRSLFGGRAREE